MKTNINVKRSIPLTEVQKSKLIKLWFTYGNNGKKGTLHNHRYIQNLIEHNEDHLEFYQNADMKRASKAGLNLDKIRLTDECIEKVKEVLNS